MNNKNIMIETDRLLLRRYQKNDLQDLYEYLSDAEVVKYEPYLPMSMEEAENNLAWRISTDEMIAVELKETHKMIGNIYIWGRGNFIPLKWGMFLIRIIGKKVM